MIAEQNHFEIMPVAAAVLPLNLINHVSSTLGQVTEQGVLAFHMTDQIRVNNQSKYVSRPEKLKNFFSLNF